MNEKTPPDEVSMSLAQALGLGNQFHKQGQFYEAGEIYKQILTAKPDQPEALHFLGVLLHQTGDFERGEQLILAAIQYDPGYVDAITNLGNMYLQRERFDEAEQLYRRTIALNPGFVNAHLNLAMLLYRAGRHDEAVTASDLALKLSPEMAETYAAVEDSTEGGSNQQKSAHAFANAMERRYFDLKIHEKMAVSLVKLGRIEEAIRAYRKWIEVEPENPKPRHHLAALTGENTPSRASDNYVKLVFDRFADSFDEQLSKLNYSAPSHVQTALVRALGASDGKLSILDAGCGTGLCAAGMRSLAGRLVGIDLSQKMLEKARARHLYDDLIESDLTTYLSRSGGEFDAIISADTLVYFGDLTDVLAASEHALKATGLIVFTVEKAIDESAPDGYRLQHHGRYSHTENYIRQVLKHVRLLAISIEEVFLRNEGGNPVLGWIVVGRKPE